MGGWQSFMIVNGIQRVRYLWPASRRKTFLREDSFLRNHFLNKLSATARDIILLHNSITNCTSDFCQTCVLIITSVISLVKTSETALFLFFQKYFLKTPEIYLSKRPKKLYRWGAKIPGGLTRGGVTLIIENRIKFRQIRLPLPRAMNPRANVVILT